MGSDLQLRDYVPTPHRVRRDRWRTTAIVAIVLAVIAATVAVFAFVTRDRSAAPAPSASPSPSVSPTPQPSQSPTPTPVVPNEPIGAAWPLTTTDEVRAWRANPSSYPYLTSAASTARAFAVRFLGVSDASVRRTPAGTYEVTRPDPNGDPMVVTRVVVQPVEGRPPYVVREASKTEELRLASPLLGATIASPLVARGTYTAVDPSIRVEIRTVGGEHGTVIASGRATYSPAGWTATVPYLSPARRLGTLVVTNGWLAGEGIAAAAVVPVTIARAVAPPLPAMPATFVGMTTPEQRVALFRSSDGALVRYLTAATAAREDGLPSLTADRARVRFTRGGNLMEVRVDGTGLRTLVDRATGSALAGTDTARGLAYVGDTDIVLRAADGTETELGEYGFVQPWITASRDGRYVYTVTGSSIAGPLVLRRTDVTRQVADVVVAPEPGFQWQTLSAGYLASGVPSVVAARYGAQRSSVVVYDESLRNPRPLLALGAAAVSRLAPDRSGRHLLLWRTDTGGTTVVQRWTTGNVVVVARGPASTVW